MNIKMIGTAALAALCFSVVATARTEPASQGTASETSAARAESAPPPPSKSATGDVAPPAISQVFRSVYIPIGKTISLDSTLDYSNASTVAIGFQCIICDSYPASLGKSGLQIMARWAVPDAGLYVTTESVAATSFSYWDAGGVIFNVFGSKLRLSLQNKGTQPIAIEQITLFRRGN